MSKIFVANPTVNTVELNYRKPTELNPKTGRMMWSERLFVERIVPGGQVALAGGANFTDMERDLIFKHQEEHYGAVWDGRARNKPNGLIWSDKEIKLDRIENALKKNQDAAEERSTEMLDRTAAALLDRQSTLAQEAGLPRPQRAEVEVAADKSRDIDVGGKGSEAIHPGATPRHNRAA
jgi:hypothetical protein